MKYFFILMTLVLTFSSFAEEREAHGNPEDEKKCFKEIRGMGCGRPEDHKKFIDCVNARIKDLSPHCQTFHKDEVQRMKGFLHSH